MKQNKLFRVSAWTLAAAMLLIFGASAAAQTQQTDAIYRSGNMYIVGNQALRGEAYAGFLRNTCPEAFAKYREGYILSSVGWGFLAAGLGMEIGGNILLYQNGFFHNSGSNPYGGVYRTGSMISSVGHVCTVASIPMLIVGYCKQHNSANIYNERQAARPYVSLNVGSNGLGLAYHF